MNDSVDIAYLGPQGTYCNEAAQRFAARLGISHPRYLECASFDEVFDLVDEGVARFGVVGKENSLEGPVTATLDNFAFRTNSVILAEEVVDVSHCLVVNKEAQLSDITCIASHPQGLAQCRRFLNKNFVGIKTLSVSSTAESARMAADDPTFAGISNKLAAKIYGAHVVQEAIQDNLENQTSFALVGHFEDADILKGSRYKTTLALFLRADKPGALQMILSEFAYAGINLTMLQSRPMKKQLGDYMFFVELDGSIHDIDVQTALDCLRLKLREVKVLGSYPACERPRN
jgi:prephenate dehydratase